MATQVGYGPPERIDGPPPLAPLYGLLPAAEAPAAGVRIVPDIDAKGVERWLNGVEVYPFPPGTGDLFNPCATSSSDPTTKKFGDESAAHVNPQFGAVVAYLAETCTTRSVWNQDDYRARAVAALMAIESGIVARQLLNGEGILLNPHLADGNGTFPNGSNSTKVGYGVALLEAEIAKSGRQGLIHCSPEIATMAREQFALDNKTGVLRTINGIVVIPDFGYVGGGTPAGKSAATGTQQWMYASGPVDVRRTEIFVTPERVEQAVDRGTGGAGNGRPNSYTYRAERYYLVDWDAIVQSAVLVDPCQTTC